VNLRFVKSWRMCLVLVLSGVLVLRMLWLGCWVMMMMTDDYTPVSKHHPVVEHFLAEDCQDGTEPSNRAMRRAAARVVRPLPASEEPTNG